MIITGGGGYKGTVWAFRVRVIREPSVRLATEY